MRICNFVGRPSSRQPHSWHKTIFSEQGDLIDASPSPGRTFTRNTWPPRGRGRGESLTSPRRIAAKLRALEVLRLRIAGQQTWQEIAQALGFRDASGAYRAYWRLMDRANWDEVRTRQLENEQWRVLTGDPTVDYRTDLARMRDLFEEYDDDNLSG